MIRSLLAATLLFGSMTANAGGPDISLNFGFFSDNGYVMYRHYRHGYYRPYLHNYRGDWRNHYRPNHRDRYLRRNYERGLRHCPLVADYYGNYRRVCRPGHYRYNR